MWSFKGIMKICLRTDRRVKSLLKAHFQVQIVDLLKEQRYYKPWDKSTRARLPVRVRSPVTFLNCSRIKFSSLSKRFSLISGLIRGKFPKFGGTQQYSICSRKKAEQNRTITGAFSFLAELAVLAKVIVNRVNKQLPKISPYQFGFRSHRSTGQAILAIRCLLQRRIKNHQPLCMTFIDLKKAFDSIDREVLFISLRDFGIPGDIISLVEALHAKPIGKLDKDNTFAVSRGWGKGAF